MSTLTAKQLNVPDDNFSVLNAWDDEKIASLSSTHTPPSATVPHATIELVSQKAVLEELLDEAVAKLNAIAVASRRADESNEITAAIVSPLLSDD